MKRTSKTISAALVAALSVTFLVPAADFSPVGVDVVSAASEAWVAPAAPAAKPAAKPAVKSAVKSTAKSTYTGTMPTSFTRLLVKGSLGAEVRLLQTRLNEMGHNLRVDGIYGPLTMAAVKDYQQKNGLVVDGVVGVNTRAKLNAPKAVPMPEPQVQPEPVTPVEPMPEPVEPAPAVDTVTAASLEANDPAVFEKSIGKDGKWIVAVTKDITTPNELVLEGTFTNGKKNEDGTDQIDRKIALYTQDDKRVVLKRFTLTAPKLTVKSPNARLQGGTFKTDVYIEGVNAQVIDAVVEGNIYFMNQEAMDTFKFAKEGKVTGEMKMVK